MADYRQIARQAAQKYGIDAGIFERQIQQESGFNPKAGSGAGARGIAQIMPATAKSWGVNPWEPVQALDAAAKNMARYVKSYKGDYGKALAAYNAGPGAVAKYGGVPPFRETQHYVKTILGGKTPKAGRARPGQRATPAVASVTSGGGAEMAAIFGDSDPIFAMLMADDAPSPVAAPAVRRRGVAAPSPKLSGSTLDRLKQIAANTGSTITSTTGGKHAPGSFHYSSRAMDVTPNKKVAAWAFAHPKLVKEFFWDPAGKYIKNGRVVKGSIGGHSDHMHLAL